ncbi:MAG TPA: type II toxin-antitoxin system RelE/ParE family toxin [Tepidisphaeraceae bacterium]
MAWEVATTSVLDQWFGSLGDDQQAEIIAKVELLKLLGPQLGRPHADTLKGSKHPNMKELRASTKDSVMRIAFAFDPDRSAILLLGGEKSGVSQRRFYKQLIVHADKLFDRHLARIVARKKAKGN